MIQIRLPSSLWKRRLETTTALVRSRTITTVSVRDRYRSEPPNRAGTRSWPVNALYVYVCARVRVRWERKKKGTASPVAPYLTGTSFSNRSPSDSARDCVRRARSRPSRLKGSVLRLEPGHGIPDVSSHPRFRYRSDHTQGRILLDVWICVFRTSIFEDLTRLEVYASKVIFLATRRMRQG